MSLPVEFLCSRKFSPLKILFVQRYFIQMMFSESFSSQDQCSQQKMKYNSGGVMLESVEKCEVEKLLYFPWWERCRCWRGSDASTHELSWPLINNFYKYLVLFKFFQRTIFYHFQNVEDDILELGHLSSSWNQELNCFIPVLLPNKPMICCMVISFKWIDHLETEYFVQNWSELR